MAKGIDGKNSTPVARALTVPGEQLPTSGHDVVSPQSIVFIWSTEILTVEEFATKMKVGETTVWKWIGNNTLLVGRHYFQNEKVIRFPWGPELINKLMEDCIMELADSDVSKKPGAVTSIVSERLELKITGPDYRQSKSDKQLTTANKLPDKSTIKNNKRRRYDISPINPDLLINS